MSAAWLRIEKMMRTKSGKTLLMLTMVLLWLNLGRMTGKAEPPALPSVFYGKVSVGDAFVPIGTNIVAKIDNVEVSSTKVKEFQGVSVYVIKIKGEGIPEGSKVFFSIGENQAEQLDAEWHSGIITLLDLTFVNQAPKLDTFDNRVVKENELLTFTTTASDDGLPLGTFTFNLGGSVPGGAVITLGGVFSWTPTEAHGPGVFIFDVCVSDGALNDCKTITVMVNEINQAPVLTRIGNQSVKQMELLTFTASATDVDLPLQSLTFSLVDAPLGASILPTTGVFSWTPTEAQGPGRYAFDVCVSDGTLSTCEKIAVTVRKSQIFLPLFLHY